MVLPCIGSQDQTTLAPLALDRPDQPRQVLADLPRAEARDQRQPPRLVLRVQPVDQLQQVALGDRSARTSARSGSARRGRTRHAPRPAGACGRRSRSCAPSPPPAGRWSSRCGRAPPRIRAAAPRGWCRSRPGAARRRSPALTPAAPHEVERVRDAVGELVVLLVARLPGGEVERPGMHPGDVGVAALAEGAQQVQRAPPPGCRPAASAPGSGTRASAVKSKSLMMSPR